MVLGTMAMVLTQFLPVIPVVCPTPTPLSMSHPFAWECPFGILNGPSTQITKEPSAATPTPLITRSASTRILVTAPLILSTSSLSKFKSCLLVPIITLATMAQHKVVVPRLDQEPVAMLLSTQTCFRLKMWSNNRGVMAFSLMALFNSLTPSSKALMMSSCVLDPLSTRPKDPALTRNFASRFRSFTATTRPSMMGSPLLVVLPATLP
mmetsp:Transcript_21328/g.44510  ORF Transcript_21328/g.44510 Transcript_21328/m.44510 type:complete len:208 (-) Transcript_21328:253-876(-)